MDPYAAPKANVADVEDSANVGPRPRQVKLAVYLLWLSLAIETVVTVPLEYARDPVGTDLFYLGVGALVFGIAVIVNVSIWRGRNWARWVWFALVILVNDLLSILAFPEELLRLPAVELALQAIIMIIDLVVLYLLFTKRGALWFQKGETQS